MILPLLLLLAQSGDCDRDAPQQTLNQCLASAYAAADAELNRVWKPAYATMQDRDREEGGTGNAQTLLASQRAWITYRDAQCAAESLAMRGGSGEAMLLFDCKLRLTTERTMFLRGIVEGD